MINLDITRMKEGSIRTLCDEVWVCLDAYDQDGITIEGSEGIIYIYHVNSMGKKLVYSAEVQEP